LGFEAHLLFLLGLKFDPTNLGDAIDKVCYLPSKFSFYQLDRNIRVLDRVVQQALFQGLGFPTCQFQSH
jgi:hypothetical protein